MLCRTHDVCIGWKPGQLNGYSHARRGKSSWKILLIRHSHTEIFLLLSLLFLPNPDQSLEEYTSNAP